MLGMLIELGILIDEVNSVECKYCNELIDNYFSLIQTLDDNKMLALNMGISIMIKKKFNVDSKSLLHFGPFNE
jgi:hypothetical protein